MSNIESARIKTKSRGSWTDTEIRSRSDDQFGFQDYAEVLARRAAEADTPLTIGVYGRWGSGKTSLMRLIEAEVQRRPAPAQTLWINVWKLSNQEELWNAFLQALLTQVHDSLGWLRRLRFDWTLLKERVRWSALWRSLLTNSYRIVITIAPMLLGILAPAEAARPDQFLVNALGPAFGGSLSLILALWLLVKPVVEIAREKVSLDLEAVLKEAPYEARVSALQQLEHQFARMVQTWVGDLGRLIIFIDDLDRCTPDKVPEVLEALKLFTTTSRCVYVIGLDHDIVRQGIKTRYSFSDETEATEYLEKIVQIPFFLPPLDENRIELFLRNYYDELEQLCPTAADVFAAGLEPNPRRVKRALNIYRTLIDLANVRVRAWEMDPVDPELVAKMVVIESRFRTLHQYLVKEPDFLLKVEEKILMYDAVNLKALMEEEKVGQFLAALVDEEGLVALVNMLRAGEKHFGDPEQQQQIASYIYLIATTEGTTQQIRPDRREREALLSDNRERVQNQIDDILQRAEAQGMSDQYVGNIYIERLEAVVTDPDRYTSEEQEAARLALTLLELMLLGDNPESVKTRLANLPEPQVEEPAWPMTESMATEQMAQKMVSSPEVGPSITYPRFRQRVLAVLDGQGLYDSGTVLIVNDALDALDGWDCLPFEPETVLIPAGPFLMGSTAEDQNASDAEKPQHTLELEAYRIGRTPITNAQYQAFVEATDYHPPGHWTDDPVPHHPVVNVSWHDAQAYCRWLSDQTGRDYRLPTEAEWEKAARGNNGRIYPWGNTPDVTKCNNLDRRISNGELWPGDITGGPRPPPLELGTTATGQYSPDGDSPFGVADMNGNVWEWTRSLWGKTGSHPDFGYPYDSDDGREDLQAGDDVQRVVRGGSFNDNLVVSRCAFRFANDPPDKFNHFGFRVVVSPFSASPDNLRLEE